MSIYTFCSGGMDHPTYARHVPAERSHAAMPMSFDYEPAPERVARRAGPGGPGRGCGRTQSCNSSGPGGEQDLRRGGDPDGARRRRPGLRGELRPGGRREDGRPRRPSGLEWHLIGPLQGNKTKLAATRFSWVHSIDRLRIAERLAAARPPGSPPLNVCVQVNISGEATKSGVGAGEALDLARDVAGLEGLVLRGFMGIAAPSADAAAQAAQFGQLRGCFDAARADGLALDTLSMGMSADLEAAIAAGATLVRVGSAIFGARPSQ